MSGMQPAPGYSPAYPQQPGYGPPGYQPNFMPQQAQPPMGAPQPTDDLAALIQRHRQQEKVIKDAAKQLDRNERRTNDARDDDGTGDSFEEWAAQLEFMADEELHGELRRCRRGSEEWREISAELKRRELESELSDGEEEVELLMFYAVMVDDGEGGWISVWQQQSFASKQDMIDQVKAKYPFARMLRWSKVKKGDMVISSQQTAIRLRSDAEVEMNVVREKSKLLEKAATDPHAAAALAGLPSYQQAPPPPPPGLSPEMQLMFQSLTQQQMEASRQNQEMIRALVAGTALNKPDEEKTMRQMMLMKDMFVTPMIEMMKANAPQPGDPRLSLDLSKEVIAGAAALAKLSHNNGGGGGDNTIGQIMELLGPVLMKGQEAQAQSQQRPQPQLQQQQRVPQFQQQPPAQLPGSQQSASTEGQQMHHVLRTKIANAISYLVGGKLAAPQMPTYALRNFSDVEITTMLNLGAEGFAALAQEAAKSIGIPSAYFSRNDVQIQFVWIYEELERKALLLDYFEMNGMLPERQRQLDWACPAVIALDPSAPLLGVSAQQQFYAQYPAIAKMQQEDDADLPPGAPGDDLPVVPQQPTAKSPLRVVPRQQPAPRPAAVEEDFVIPAELFPAEDEGGNGAAQAGTGKEPKVHRPTQPEFA